MESIFKVILGIFISVIIVFSGFGVLEANNEAMEAEHYLHAVGRMISESDFSKEVVRTAIEKADAQGYKLYVQYAMDGQDILYAVVSLEYPYDIALFHLHTMHRKQITVY